MLKCFVLVVVDCRDQADFVLALGEKKHYYSADLYQITAGRARPA